MNCEARPKPSMRSVASIRLPSTWNKGIRTEPEVERIETRTGIKAGAPVCSGSPLCSLSYEPRIGPSRCVCRLEKQVCLLPFCFQSLLPIVTFSVQTSDEPLIPIRLPHSLPLFRSSPCHISPLQQNKATPPSDAWRQPTERFGPRPRRHVAPRAARGRCVKTKTNHFHLILPQKAD